MEGLVQEGEEIINQDGNAHIKDAALIAAAQRVEHYEIAGYGTARTYASELGLNEAKRLLDDTLSEEKAADKTLNKLATGGWSPAVSTRKRAVRHARWSPPWSIARDDASVRRCIRQAGVAATRRSTSKVHT